MAPADNAQVPVVAFDPPEGYDLDVELYDGDELRRRAGDDAPRIERLDFHVLLYLCRRGYRHMVDFDTLACRAGSVVLIEPGRVHRFGDLRSFQGWMVIFRSELLPPAFGHALLRDGADLAAHSQLDRHERRAFVQTLEQMARDARGPAGPLLNALLNRQVQTLLLRLAAAHAGSAEGEPVARDLLERFHRYRAAVEREHARWHHVQRYAKALGCSEKSLARATRAATGMSAKELLTARLLLEAKRRLAHSATPVATLADELGFSEPTNFVKFFRRESGVTPGAFRRAHRYG